MGSTPGGPKAGSGLPDSSARLGTAMSLPCWCELLLLRCVHIAPKGEWMRDCGALKKGSPQPHCQRWELERSLLGGAFRCVVGCLAASLAPTGPMPVGTFSPPSVTTKNAPKHCQLSPGDRGCWLRYHVHEVSLRPLCLLKCTVILYFAPWYAVFILPQSVLLPNP